MMIPKIVPNSPINGEDVAIVARVFKTVSEPHVGDVTFFRIMAGQVNNGSEVYNAPRESGEKLNHLP